MMTEEEYKEYERKQRAKAAVDVILQAEALKKDKEIKSYVKTEMKERAKALDAVIGKKKEEVKKPASRKKK
jgi:hypothetical protein